MKIILKACFLLFFSFLDLVILVRPNRHVLVDIVKVLMQIALARFVQNLVWELPGEVVHGLVDIGIMTVSSHTNNRRDCDRRTTNMAI
jgi:hypothetical protein